jgi:hypothetical protein
MMAPFLLAGICVVLGLLFVLFAFIDPPWFLQPIFDINLLYFLSFRTQRMVIGAFLIVVPPTILLGLSDYF